MRLLTRTILFSVFALTALAQTPPIGPQVGWRLPIYSKYCEALIGKPDVKCWFYLKLAPGQATITTDPAGTSDGIWTIEIQAAPGTNPTTERTITVGTGLIGVTTETGIQLSADTAYMMHRLFYPAGSVPQAGEPCNQVGTAAIIIDRTRPVLACVDWSGNGTQFLWSKIGTLEDPRAAPTTAPFGVREDFAPAPGQTVFPLSKTPLAGTFSLWINGLSQASRWYQVSGRAVISFAPIPDAAEVWVTYWSIE